MTALDFAERIEYITFIYRQGKLSTEDFEQQINDLLEEYKEVAE